MNQVTLNKNSWHFKYYSMIVSDNPPKSLCPYFWTMVIIMLLSPIVACFLSINWVMKNVTAFFDSVVPKKQKPAETYEQIIARWDREEASKKKRERFWNKAADVFLFIVKYAILPTLGLFLIFVLYTHTVKVGWLVMLITVGVVVLFALFIIGIIKLFELFEDQLSKSTSKFFTLINPFNWKATKILGEMIKAQYTKMCPLITWTGENDKEDKEYTVEI